MATTLSIQKLVPLIDALSQNITEIATILRENLQVSTGNAMETENLNLVKEERTEALKKEAINEAKSSTESSKDAKPVITIEQVRAVLAEKSQAGLTIKVKDLLASFGSVKLSGIDPARYGELIEAAKELQ